MAQCNEWTVSSISLCVCIFCIAVQQQDLNILNLPSPSSVNQILPILNMPG